MPYGSKDVREDEGEEGDADHAVHGEERSVESSQVARADQRVLVGEEPGDHDHAGPVPPVHVEAETGGHEERHGRDVHPARTEECTTLAEAHSPGVESLRPVDLEVEEREEAVESSYRGGGGAGEWPCQQRQHHSNRHLGRAT